MEDYSCNGDACVGHVLAFREVDQPLALELDHPEDHDLRDCVELEV